MFGVFENVPAFDANFCRSMHMHKLNKDPLGRISKIETIKYNE
jgi:hypothetical protein